MARSRRLVIGLVAALAVPSAFACNALIGLDDFDKGLCSGARCDSGPSPDVLLPDAGDSGPIDAGKGADPVSWARWKMPNYDDAGLPNPPEYAVAGDEVKDKVTGLVWRASTLRDDFTLEQAAGECKKLGDWRVPKRIELVTLLDFGKASAPFVNQVFMVQNVRVWTSSEVRPYVGGAEQRYWTVNFDDGKVEPRPGNTIAKALCVKAR